MGRGNALASMKEMFKDERLHVYLGQIKKLFLAPDRSYLKVMVLVYPEQRNIIATYTFDSVGPDAGDFEFPSIGDMVLGVQVDGDDDSSYIIKRLTSKEDTIPANAGDGSKVQRTLAGKKFWNISDTRINLARGLEEPTENVILGQVWKAMMIALMDEHKEHAQNAADHRHIGNLGYLTFKPDLEQEFLSRKENYNTIEESPIKDEAVLSDLTFTEK